MCRLFEEWQCVRLELANEAFIIKMGQNRLMRIARVRSQRCGGGGVLGVRGRSGVTSVWIQREELEIRECATEEKYRARATVFKISCSLLQHKD